MARGERASGGASLLASPCRACCCCCCCSSCSSCSTTTSSCSSSSSSSAPCPTASSMSSSRVSAPTFANRQPASRVAFTDRLDSTMGRAPSRTRRTATPGHEMCESGGGATAGRSGRRAWRSTSRWAPTSAQTPLCGCWSDRRTRRRPGARGRQTARPLGSAGGARGSPPSTRCSYCSWLRSSNSCRASHETSAPLSAPDALGPRPPAGRCPQTAACSAPRRPTAPPPPPQRAAALRSFDEAHAPTLGGHGVHAHLREGAIARRSCADASHGGRDEISRGWTRHADSAAARAPRPAQRRLVGLDVGKGEQRPPRCLPAAPHVAPREALEAEEEVRHHRLLRRRRLLGRSGGSGGGRA